MSRFDYDDPALWIFDKLQDYIIIWESENLGNNLVPKNLFKLLNSRVKARDLLMRIERILSKGKEEFPKHRQEAIRILAEAMKLYEVPNRDFDKVMDVVKGLRSSSLYEVIKDLKYNLSHTLNLMNDFLREFDRHRLIN
jgi:hypothetical protein